MSARLKAVLPLTLSIGVLAFLASELALNFTFHWVTVQDGVFGKYGLPQNLHLVLPALFVSWGLCCRGPKSTYHVVVGRAQDVRGPYLDRQGRDMAQGGGSLVVMGDKDWKALGHNSAYTFDGKDYLVLHAYETADHYKQKLKVMDIHWDKDGWPTVDPKDLDRYVSARDEIVMDEIK